MSFDWHGFLQASKEVKDKTEESDKLTREFVIRLTATFILIAWIYTDR